MFTAGCISQKRALIYSMCARALLLMCVECLEGKVICLVNGIIRDISHWQHRTWTNRTISLCPTDFTRTEYGFLAQKRCLNKCSAKENSWESLKTNKHRNVIHILCLLQSFFSAYLFPVHRNWREWRHYRPTCSWQLSFALMQGGNSFFIIHFI